MSTLPSQQNTAEKFIAKVTHQGTTENFTANKVNIKKTVDTFGAEGWALMGFHDTTDKNTGHPVTNGIHLYIRRAPQKGEHDLDVALTPPDFKINSARYFKLLDEIPDEDNELDTIEEYPGEGGHMAYTWDAGKKTITGTFTFEACDFDEVLFQITGEFRLFNPEGDA